MQNDIGATAPGNQKQHPPYPQVAKRVRKDQTAGSRIVKRRRLLTLEDTVEFFNLILELGLSVQEKKDLVEFMRLL